MEQDSWLKSGMGFEDEPAKDRYKFFMRPEPKEGLGPIEIDPETGRRFRNIELGMVRNATEKKSMKVILDPLPHTIIENGKPLQGWYKSKFEPEGVRARPCFTDAILTEPYGGYCTVGCAFCYINSGFRGYRGTGVITVPRDYGGHVRKQLSVMKTSAAGYFSSFTDPFLPLEDVYHNTENGAREFTKLGLPIFFLSRLAYPSWAFDALRLNGYSYAQKSINTPDPDDWKKLSPAALPLMDHLAEIRELRDAGIYVSIQVNPILPGIVDHDDVVRLMGMLGEAGAHHAIVKFVEAGYSWAPTMVERIEKRFGGNRAAKFRDLFVDNIGGQRTISEEYRMEGHRIYAKAAKEAGMTYATCYEYKYERDTEGNITSKTGVSIGREFITADQCHGHKVPLYSRKSVEDQFTEVAECPPTGCMYCADDNGGKSRCGSELFGKATALRTSDLRVSVKP